jgi:hypothetical protein
MPQYNQGGSTRGAVCGRSKLRARKRAGASNGCQRTQPMPNSMARPYAQCPQKSDRSPLDATVVNGVAREINIQVVHGTGTLGAIFKQGLENNVGRHHIHNSAPMSSIMSHVLGVNWPLL